MASATDDTITDIPERLTAEMASFRLLVLAFIKNYWSRRNDSPSYGEICAGLDAGRSRVRHAVKSLERDGKLRRNPGTRGLFLPSDGDAALQTLRDMGYSVTIEGNSISIPGVRNPTLLPPPELTYPSRHGDTENE